jgi:hypothetical protein
MGVNNEYGDSEFLADRDNTTRDFRESEKETKRKIIEKMLTLRHNMKYNKHLLSVYMRAKGLFDTMVDEHRSQLEYLDEIYRHLNNLIRENLSAQRNNRADARSKLMMTELVKDKKRIGVLLKKMRSSFDKLMDIDTVIGTTIENINEITLMDENAEATADDDDDDIDDEDLDDSDDDNDDDSEDDREEDLDDDSDDDNDDLDDDSDNEEDLDDNDDDSEDDREEDLDDGASEEDDDASEDDEDLEDGEDDEDHEDDDDSEDDNEEDNEESEAGPPNSGSIYVY